MANLQNDAELLSLGFPNLRVIQRSIADLHKRFPGAALLGLQFPSSLSPAIIHAAMAGDPDVSVGRIVSTMLHHFHLPADQVVVRFSDNLKEAGRISETAHGKRLVEMQSRFRGSGQIVAVLAHEIAHFFLDTHGLRYSDTFENEFLTDTTAIYLGAGWSMLSAYEYTVSQRFGLNTSRSISRSKMGYLTPEEFGYVLARRCKVTNEDVAPWIPRKEGKAALSAGFTRLRRELGQAPLATAGLLPRLKYKYAVLRSTKGSGLDAKLYDYGAFSIEAGVKKSVLFRCPRCTQQLRLPVGVRRAGVTCKGCKEAFTCSS
jgi:hypothetical protein